MKLTCKSKGVTRDSLSSTVHMGLPLPSTILESTIFPEVSPPVVLLSFWRNKDELNTCSTRLEDFWDIRLAVLPVWSAWKENGSNVGLIKNAQLSAFMQILYTMDKLRHMHSFKLNVQAYYMWVCVIKKLLVLLCHSHHNNNYCQGWNEPRTDFHKILTDHMCGLVSLQENRN